MYGIVPYMVDYVTLHKNVLYILENSDMSATLKKERIDLRLTNDDKSLIEDAAALSNLTISQFMLASASRRAEEVIEEHRRMKLNETSWNLVMDAISNPPAPNAKLRNAARRLQDME